MNRGDTLLGEGNYDSALEVYLRAQSKGFEQANRRIEEIWWLLLEKGDELYAKGDVRGSVNFYSRVAGYGSEDGKQRIVAFGIEAGKAYAEQGNQSAAVKCYEQAALYGSEEAKDRLKQSKHIEEEKLKVAEAKRKEEAEQQRRKEQAEAEEKQRQRKLEDMEKQLTNLRKEKEAAEKREREATEQLKKREEEKKLKEALERNQRALEEKLRKEEAERKALEEQRSREAELEKQRQAQRAFEEKQRQEEANRKAAEKQLIQLVQPKANPVPAIARGYEDIYRQFLKGKLIYRPTEGNDAGKIELSIASLANPLEGTFDLSRCGDTGQYLSIATGYRKGKKVENASKIEVWLSPKFLIEKEINGSASHFQPIMGTWDGALAPIGVFFTWGSWDDLKYYDYVTNTPATQFASQDVYQLWYENCFNPFSSHQHYHYNHTFLKKIFLSF